MRILPMRTEPDHAKILLDIHRRREHLETIAKLVHKIANLH
jgi:hypothetical protein